MAEKKSGLPVYWWRRISQALFLLLFMVLFRLSDFVASDRVHDSVNLFFRLDPLVAASAMLAARSFISLLIPALVIVGLTLALGRFFCGWVCPLGTLIDASQPLIRSRRTGPARPGLTRVKYYLLFFVLSAALFGLPLVGYVDPFAILARGLTLAVDPALYTAVSTPFDTVYQSPTLDFMTPATEPVYSFLRNHILSYKRKAYEMALPALFMLAAIFALERVERRFWCRNLCPLGGLLALASRPAILRQHPGRACGAKGCTTCRDICRMGAIDNEGRISPQDCNLCLDCVAYCDASIISFKWKRPKTKPAPMDISRRGVFGTMAAGITLPVFWAVRSQAEKPKPYLVRPPGAAAEKEFLGKCVRCGECMKVCINNALQPALLEAGVEGMWSPVVVARLGYCEYNCTLCGQVCPTGAIREMTVEEKKKIRIGRAVFDRDRCLPWAKGKPCVTCEEMCPIPDKAIRMRKAMVKDQQGNDVEVQQPFVVDELCIGCGRCENACPLPGHSAVRVISEGESRDPDNEDYQLNEYY